jgi:hypothetical protein
VQQLHPGLSQGGFSFWDIQLQPLANAINKNLGKGADLFLFNLGGELGTSYFGWAGKWLQYVGDARQAALANGKAKHAKELQIGLKINFERVPGYASQLQGGIKKDLAQKLFAALDYVAISAYAPVPAKPDPEHFQVRCGACSDHQCLACCVCLVADSGTEVITHRHGDVAPD